MAVRYREERLGESQRTYIRQACESDRRDNAQIQGVVPCDQMAAHESSDAGADKRADHLYRSSAKEESKGRAGAGGRKTCFCRRVQSAYLVDLVQFQMKLFAGS